MVMYWTTQAEYLLRIVVAGLCGALLGYERKSRLKEAGVRTHFIVALASALMMIVSKYGFWDMVGFENVKFDPARVASGIVSGVGFIGAGLIFVRKQAVNGITTASGIWATVGIGMALGSGLYFLGVSSTLLVLLAQFVLHHNRVFLKLPSSDQICIVMENNEQNIAKLQKAMEDAGIKIMSIKIEQTPSGDISVDMLIKAPAKFNNNEIINLFKSNKAIKSINM
ncbi:MAG: MgtC/SapB family protein [Clostridia bacterium]|nr:MgtC/SapB family protein [Clostridia bacterium]